jgi:hypothetical protein
MKGHSNHFGRLALVALAGCALTIAIAGCGGGGSSYNVDDGFYTDGRGNKTITRTLDNRTRQDVVVRLEINDRDYLDTIRIPPDDYVNVTIERMRVEDYVYYHARFDNGDTTDGRFGEDGTTVFTDGDSRAGGLTSTNTDGKAAVRSGGRTVKLSVPSNSPPK